MKQEDKKYLDILEVLSSDTFRILVNNSLKDKIFRRILILKYFLKGKIGFSKTFLNLLPTRLRPYCFLGNKYNFEFLNLLGFKLNYLFFIDTLAMVKELVALDQYCAKEFIKDNLAIIDVGANIGIFSLFVHYLSPNSHVYCFEPFSKAFDVLEKNVLDNDLSSHLHVFNQALGDKNAYTRLMISPGGSTGNMLEDSRFLKGKEKIFNKSENISLTTLDEFIGKNKINKVDFIKIDAEGYEREIINGAKQTIKKFHPVIACSAYHLSEDKTEIPKLVLEIEPKYKYRLEKRVEEDFIFWY